MQGGRRQSCRWVWIEAGVIAGEQALIAELVSEEVRRRAYQDLYEKAEAGRRSGRLRMRPSQTSSATGIHICSIALIDR